MTDETAEPNSKPAADQNKADIAPSAAPKPAFDVNAMLAQAGTSPEAANVKQVKSGRIYFPVALVGQSKLLMNLDLQAIGPFVALMIRFREDGPRQFTVLHQRDPKDPGILEKYPLFLDYVTVKLPEIVGKLATGGYAQKVLDAVTTIGQRHDAHVTFTLQEAEMRLEAAAQRHLMQHDAILDGMKKLPDFGTKSLQAGN